MKRAFFALFLLCVTLPTGAPAATPEEQYVDYYQLIQQADQMKDQGREEAAFAIYRRAEDGLKKLKAAHPQWNEKIINFRLADLAEKIKPLAAKYPEPKLTPPPAEPKAATAKAAKEAPAAATSSFESQLNLLNEEIIRLRMDRTLLERKLAEALAARPAASDPAELARAEARVKDLEKENAVLKTTIEQNRKDAAKMPDPAAFSAAKQALEQAQKDLKEQSKQVASLQKENASLTKLKDENATLKKQANQARDMAEEAEKRATASARELAALKKENENLKDEVKRAGKMPKPGESEDTAALRKELADARRKLAEQAVLTAKADTLGQQLKDAQSTIAALRKDNEKMEKLLTDPAFATPAPPAGAAEMEKQLAAARRAAELAHTREAEARAAAEKAHTEAKSLEEQLRAAMAASGKSSPRDAAKIKELEGEKSRLEKELKAATKELNDRRSKREMAKVGTMADELAALKARLETLEARKLPYTKEELALFKRPDSAPAAPAQATEKASQELPAAARPLIAEAQRDFASRRFADAERKYKQVLAQNDSHVYTLANLAAAQIEQGDFREAEMNLERALAVAPNDAFARAQMGYLRMRQNKLDDALDHLSRAAQAEPNNAIIQNYLGIVLSEKGQRAAAEAALRKAVQLSPGYADAHANLAVIYATQQPPMLELAKWHYQKARAAGHPADPEFEKKLQGQ